MDCFSSIFICFLLISTTIKWSEIYWRNSSVITHHRSVSKHKSKYKRFNWITFMLWRSKWKIQFIYEILTMTMHLLQIYFYALNEFVWIHRFLINYSFDGIYLFVLNAFFLISFVITHAYEISFDIIALYVLCECEFRLKSFAKAYDFIWKPSLS